MRQALIYNQDQLAGLLTEDENGYTFQYDTAYIKSSDAESISLTLPISEKPYTSLILFPFSMRKENIWEQNSSSPTLYKSGY